MNMEDRIVDLEIRLTRQDDLVDTLNKAIYLQQKKIDQLDALCSALARTLKDLREAASEQPVHEKPPHY